MSASIRIPTELPAPDRASYGDRFHSHRSEWIPEIGGVRRRQKYRRTPRTFDVQFTLDQVQYQIFDLWYQNDIRGGELSFDLQMLDDHADLMWYTVQGRTPYSFERSDNGEPVYVIKWQVTTLDDGFYVRPARTDELQGYADVGVDDATAAILITRALMGTAEVGVETSSRFSLIPLQGLAEIGMYSLPTARFEIPYYPELSRHWQRLNWIHGISAQDVNTNADVVSRAWMEI